MTREEKRIARLLFEIGCVKFGAFRLKLHETNPEAPLSPIYINLRLLQSYPKILKKVAALLEKLIKPLKFDLIAAIPMAATPLGTALSLKTGIPLVTPRPLKTHGLGGGIDGIFEKGQTALLLDDLVTRADSKIEAINNLKGKGLKVANLVVLIDREQGGKKELAKVKIRLHAIFQLSNLLKFYLGSRKINKEIYDKTLNYLS